MLCGPQRFECDQEKRTVRLAHLLRIPEPSPLVQRLSGQPICRTFQQPNPHPPSFHHAYYDQSALQLESVLYLGQSGTMPAVRAGGHMNQVLLKKLPLAAAFLRPGPENSARRPELLTEHLRHSLIRHS